MFVQNLKRKKKSTCCITAIGFINLNHQAAVPQLVKFKPFLKSDMSLCHCFLEEKRLTVSVHAPFYYYLDASSSIKINIQVIENASVMTKVHFYLLLYLQQFIYVTQIRPLSM